MTGRHVEEAEPLYNWGRLACTGAEPAPPPYRQMRRGSKYSRGQKYKYNVEKRQRR